MPQDAFTLRYLCEELNGIFSEGKVNRITQPTADSSVFTVFTKKGVVKKLLLDVSPSSPRIGVIEEEPEQTILSSNFNMLLKKHLLSATLKGVSMVGFDRIVKIDFLPSAEIFDAPPKTLYVELMGRYSNVILTENGVVLGGNRQPEDSRPQSEAGQQVQRILQRPAKERLRGLLCYSRLPALRKNQQRGLSG